MITTTWIRCEKFTLNASTLIPLVPHSTMSIHFESVIPVLRIFDEVKAAEFYQGFLGFKCDWTHRFEEGFPLYQQVSRDGLVLHLSEHHGDGGPAIHVRVMMTGVDHFHKEVSSKQYKYLRPGCDKSEVTGMLEMKVTDPFGNRLTFCQREEGKQ
ncbi:putative glyoxalase [Kockovaella imperatae]|uniref:Bleomycin resistance protein n=1 Tax=Kockovaella imperatae TaxID=4999 RepID=A0A1Y1UDB4_9TREE|nr:putative glyoxalase [Kockovaella imperatae]ORX35537.1 putative glyoxalase [Kockovaella imperatae]